MPDFPNCPSDQTAPEYLVDELASILVRRDRDEARAASVLARAQFLRRLKSLGEEFGITLPKGAGPPVLEAAKRFLAKYGESELSKVAKTHFKTTQAVLESARA